MKIKELQVRIKKKNSEDTNNFSIIGTLMRQSTSSETIEDDIFYKLSLVILQKIPNIIITSDDLNLLVAFLCFYKKDSPVQVNKINNIITNLPFMSRLYFKTRLCPRTQSTRRGGKRYTNRTKRRTQRKRK